MSRARAGAAALRRETGAAAVEYAGVLLLVGLLFVGLFRIGLPAEAANWAGKVIAVVDAGDGGGGTTGSAQGTLGDGRGTTGRGSGSSGNGQGTVGDARGTTGRGSGASGDGQGTSGTGRGTGGQGSGTSGSGRGTSGNSQGTSPSGQGTSGNGQGTSGNGQATNGNGQGTSGNGQGTSGNGQGASGSGRGISGSGSGGGDGGQSIPCTQAADAGLCMTALGAPNAIEEKVQDRARNAVTKAAANLANSDDVKPGSPEHQRLVNKLNKAVDQLRDSRRITEHPLIKATSPIRKFANPRYKDLQQHANRLSKVLPVLKNRKPPEVPTGPASAAAPSSRAAGAANKVLRGMGRFGKGLGIVGTAISGYDNIRKDGWAKGATETLGGAAATYGASAAVMAGCGAIGVATAGVGGLACAGVAIVGGYFAGRYGKQITAWAYDRAGEAWNFTKDKVSDGARAAAHTAVEGGRKVLGGAEKVISSLKPGFL